MARILVVDDAPAVLDVLEDVLSEAGHEVIRAVSGAEAVGRFRNERPELAVLDVMMPDMDGLAVLDAIRQIDPRVPVILITGLASEDVRPKVEHHAGVALFEKGSGVDSFLRLVNETLGGPGNAAS